MRVHIDKNLLAQFGKPKVLSRGAIPGSFGITCYQAIRLQAGEDGVDIAFTNFQLFISLEGLDHLIAVTLAVLQKIQDNNVQQPLTKLSLPIV